MTVLKKITVRLGAAACLAGAVFFACEKVPDYCGSSEYNPDTQFCLADKTYSKCGGAEYNPATETCMNGIVRPLCGAAGYDPQTQFCFSGQHYDKCAGAEYNPTSQRCEGGVLKSKCNDNYFNPTTEFCSGVDGNVHAKCNGVEYDPTTQRCESGALKTKCGTDYFDPAAAFCDNGGVYPLCGGERYETATQRCNGGILETKCGENFYNPANDFCSGDNVYPKCGGQTYNPATSVCENNVLKTECGTDYFSPATQFCSNGQVYSKCGGNVYDPLNNEVCDAGTIKVRCGTGANFFDTTFAFCVDAVIYQKCKGAVYDPAEKKCENNILKSKCGTGFFNPEVEFCHNNSIYELCNGKTYDPTTTECKEISMVFVEGGSFNMGCTPTPAEVGVSGSCNSDELPVHRVTLSGFYIGRYEVTQKQWEDIMGANPSSVKGYDLPVTNVSWNDVQDFIRLLNIETGKTYRLPTEAEWEFAARGGIRSEGYKYAGSNTIGDVAWYNVGGGPRIVGTKQPNELGIYDMSGNVSEWVHDGLRTYNNGSQVNPMGPTTSGSDRVFRGGGWYYGARDARVSYRISYGPDYRNYDLGFRLVLVSP